jgi:hypothetical protein
MAARDGGRDERDGLAERDRVEELVHVADQGACLVGAVPGISRGRCPGTGLSVGSSPECERGRPGRIRPARHRLSRQVCPADLAAASQPVVGGQRRHPRLGQQHLGVQAAGVEGRPQDGGISDPVTHGGGHVGGPAEHDPHLGDLRIRRTPPGDLLDQAGAIPCLDDDGEEVVRHGLTANALDHGAQVLDSGPPLRQQHRACRREEDPAAGPVQQPDAELALQLADRRG